MPQKQLPENNPHLNYLTGRILCCLSKYFYYLVTHLVHRHRRNEPLKAYGSAVLRSEPQTHLQEQREEERLLPPPHHAGKCQYQSDATSVMLKYIFFFLWMFLLSVMWFLADDLTVTPENICFIDEEKVISSNVSEGACIGGCRMENTNRILNVTTSRNAKLVKCKDTRQITQQHKNNRKSQTVQVFMISPVLLATASSLLPDETGDCNSLGNEKSSIMDILQGSKWLCRLSWNQAELVSCSSGLSPTDPDWFLVQPPNCHCAALLCTLLQKGLISQSAAVVPRQRSEPPDTVPELISLPRNWVLSCAERPPQDETRSGSQGCRWASAGSVPTVCRAIWCCRAWLPGHGAGLRSCGTGLPPTRRHPPLAGD